ncbi:MAG: hypothetical protein ACOCWS_03440, partial [Alkalispirochaetaceae bacterium]
PGTIADLDALAALDDRTLLVELERPVPYLADLLGYGVFSPVWRPAVEGWPAGTEDAWPHGEPPPMADRRWVRLDPATGRYRQDHGWARPGRRHRPGAAPGAGEGGFFPLSGIDATIASWKGRIDRSRSRRWQLPTAAVR